MTPVKRPATWLFLGVLLFSGICLYFNFTPVAVRTRPADTLFSVQRAMAHLGRIAAVPHSLGTAAKDTVGVYLDSVCGAMGLRFDRLFFTGIKPVSKGLVIGWGVNLRATLKGTGGGKKILVMGHYDSQPNSLGAGDDGSACAAMLETARALRSGSPLNRDVEFLFTDGEEDGLLGATAFARDSPLLKDIGLVLNFDGRGDAGRCIMFRTSASSHWLIDGYARAPIHHVTGSFYNELFNLLPNNTDLTPLLSAHVPGIDFAYVEGFTAYHNLTDNIVQIDQRTVQEEGDNMLGMIRYFGHTDLDAPSAAYAGSNAGNDTFFNVIGPLMVHYSPTLNFMLVLAANLLALLSLGYGLIAGGVRFIRLLTGLLVFIVILAVLYFVARWTLVGLRAMYSLYEGYYPNSYHAGYFYVALAAESVLLFTLLYRWPLGRWPLSSLFMAVLILQLLLLDVLYRYIPAGVYWLYWPLIGAALAFPFLPVEKSRNGARPNYWPIIVSLAPAVLLLPPMVYSLALIFDLQGQAAAGAAVTGLLLGLTLPVLKTAFLESRWLLPAVAFCLCMILTVAGIAVGGYDASHPFKTDLHYLVDRETHTARWVSNTRKPDRANGAYFKHFYLTSDPYQYPLEKFNGNGPVITATAPFVDLPAAKLTVRKDTLINGQRVLDLVCEPPPGTASLHFSFNPANPAASITIGGVTQEGPQGWLDVVNPGSELDLVITCAGGKEFNVHVVGRFLGLPAAAGFRGYPANVVPFPGPFANTTMVMDQRVF